MSHREGVVYTADNQVNIRLKSKLKTHLWAVMKRQDTQNSKKMDEYVWTSNNGVDIEVFARFPGKGMYSLTIFGRPFKLEPLPEDHNDIWIRIDYTIVAEGDICSKYFGHKNMTDFILNTFRITGNANYFKLICDIKYKS